MRITLRKKFLHWLRGHSEFSIHWGFQKWCKRHRNWSWACSACFDEILLDVQNGLTVVKALERQAEREAHSLLGEDYFA